MAEPSMLLSGLLSFVQGRVELIFHLWDCWPRRKQIFFKNLFLNFPIHLLFLSVCMRETDRREPLVWWCACVEVRGDLWRSHFSVLSFYRVGPRV